MRRSSTGLPTSRSDHLGDAAEQRFLSEAAGFGGWSMGRSWHLLGGTGGFRTPASVVKEIA